MEGRRMKEKITDKQKRRFRWGCFIIGTLLILLLGPELLRDRKYNIVSGMVAFFACGIFYLNYEKREGSIRRMVLLAVMTAISVGGRCLFAPIPGFKPVTAIVVLCGIYMGPESGFLVGSLSAVVSNIFFGQGPWTPFQMFTWGVIGLLAGIPWVSKWLRHKGALVIYGVFSGILYTLLMNVWSVFSLDEGWNFSRYLVSLGTALPFTITYAVSNVVFLLLTIKPIGEKLNRIQIKHQIF